MLELGQVDMVIKQILLQQKPFNVGDGQIQQILVGQDLLIMFVLHVHLDMHLILLQPHYVKQVLQDAKHILQEHQHVLLV